MQMAASSVGFVLLRTERICAVENGAMAKRLRSKS